MNTNKIFRKLVANPGKSNSIIIFLRSLFCPKLLIVIFVFCSVFELGAQNSYELSLSVLPSDEKYLYEISEEVSLNIDLASQLMNNTVFYEIRKNGKEVIDEGDIKLTNGRGKITSTLDCPGFLLCNVFGVAGTDTFRATCGYGFGVEKIMPKGELPANFKRFWDEAKVELVRIPIDARLEEVDAPDPGDAKRFKVSMANVNGTRVYGWLHLPDGEGPFPTVLSIPGSGVGRTGRFDGFTEAGIAVFAIEIHGLEPGEKEIIGAVQWVVPQDDVIKYFIKLEKGILDDYHSLGKDDPYRYYHRRSLQGAVRAIDYLYTRSDVDTSKIFVFGGSQGGGLSLLSAAIDKRIKGVVATVPGFCDNTERLPGNAGRSNGLNEKEKAQFINTMLYYDAALAAQLIDVPVMIGVGFIDDTCRPVNVYSAYNMLKGRKKIENFYNTGHGSPTYWRSETIDWFKNIK